MENNMANDREVWRGIMEAAMDIYKAQNKTKKYTIYVYILYIQYTLYILLIPSYIPILLQIAIV